MADPTTVSELIEWFENNFICCVGPARAYFDMQIGPRDEAGNHPVTRVLYQTYAVKCGDIVGSEGKLVAAMYVDFGQLIGAAAHETTLFWRYPEKISLLTNLTPVLGKALVTQEAVEDGLVEIPVGAVLGDDCVYYEDCGSVRSWTLSARLSIPAMDWMMPTTAFFTKKAEGAAPLSI